MQEVKMQFLSWVAEVAPQAQASYTLYKYPSMEKNNFHQHVALTKQTKLLWYCSQWKHAQHWDQKSW